MSKPKFFASPETNVVFILIFCGGEDCSAFTFLPGSLQASSSLALVSFSLYSPTWIITSSQLPGTGQLLSVFFYLDHCKQPASWYSSASPFIFLPGSLQAASSQVLASFSLYSPTWIIANNQLPCTRQLLPLFSYLDHCKQPAPWYSPASPFILLPGSLQAASSLVLASFSLHSSTWIIATLVLTKLLPLFSYLDHCKRQPSWRGSQPTLWYWLASCLLVSSCDSSPQTRACFPPM